MTETSLSPVERRDVEPTGETGTGRLRVDLLHEGAARPRVLSSEWLLQGPGWTWLRLAVDLAALVAAVAGAVMWARAADITLYAAEYLLAYPALVTLLLALRGNYRRRIGGVVLGEVVPVGGISIAAMFLLALTAVADAGGEAVPLVVRVWLLSSALITAGRLLLTVLQRRARVSGAVATPTLIVGAGHVGSRVATRLQEHPEFGLRPVGFLDSEPRNGDSPRPVPVLGSPSDLPAIAARTGARHVILAFSSTPDRALIPLARQCDRLGLEVSLVPRLFESMNERAALQHLGALPLLERRAVDPKGFQFALKHVIDFAVAAIGLLVTLPLIGLIAAAIKLSSPGPVLFRQRRVGRDGQVFDLLKFRSMRTPARELDGFQPEPGLAPGGVEGADRRTRVGRVLRRTSLDELPQLINVLRGEMSLVGPRPERPEFVEVFLEDVEGYTDRHRVKSGITGWAQVHGLRGQTPLGDRIQWDNYYIENWSLRLDFKILARTLLQLTQEGDDS